MKPFPDKKYKVIYADPPWSYRNFQGKGKAFGDVSAHYATMTTESISEMPVKNIIDPSGCLLFMWATYPNLPVALSVMASWGFTYKTVAFTWVKTRGKGWYSGLGFYTNANAEVCLLGRVGKFTRVSKSVKQLVVAELGRHSEKPSEVHDRIEKLCGDVSRIELFARRHAPGWDVWGNEVI